jgi:hypothetical protein
MRFALVIARKKFFARGAAVYFEKELTELGVLHIVYDGNDQDRILRAIDNALEEWKNIELRKDLAVR